MPIKIDAIFFSFSLETNTFYEQVIKVVSPLFILILYSCKFTLGKKKQRDFCWDMEMLNAHRVHYIRIHRERLITLFNSSPVCY